MEAHLGQTAQQDPQRDGVHVRDVVEVELGHLVAAGHLLLAAVDLLGGGRDALGQQVHHDEREVDVRRVLVPDAHGGARSSWSLCRSGGRGRLA